MTAYDIATGKAVWWFTGLTWQLKPTPVIDGDRLYILGWAGGSDLGNQVELPPWSDIVRLRDANGDGKLQPSEAGDPQLERDWKEADLDRDGLLGERDWKMYQGRRRALNSITAIRLGRQRRHDVEEPALALHQEPAERSLAVGVRRHRLSAQGRRHLHRTGRRHRRGSQAGSPDRRARPVLCLPCRRRPQDLAISQTGHLVVLKAGAEWEILAVNDLDEECYATPALADGRVYVRTRSALYAFAAPASAQ